MKSALFMTRVDHCRAGPAVHRFRYRSMSALVDLDRWGTADPFLSFDRFGVFSLMSNDYLRGKSGSVKERLLSYLAKAGETRAWARIELLTSPRFFGYVFNPVNFYLCYLSGSARPELCVAEVNNTFGETHLYIARADETNASRRNPRFVAEKQFHVSPFYDRSGTYEFVVERGDDMIDIRVHLCREGRPVFTSGIAGKLSPPPSLLRAALAGLRYSWLTVPRIMMQAGALYFRRKLPLFSKPAPKSEWTIGARRPTLIERAAAGLLFRYFSGLRRGELVLTLPSGEERRFGARGSGAAPARCTVREWSFFPRVLFKGDIGFGETFADGVWTSDELPGLLRFFADNMEEFDDRRIIWTKLMRVMKALRHRLRANTKRGSKRNIPAHYDLGNDLFRRFLDERLVYSCAVYEDPNESLEQAQLNKLRKMMLKAGIRREHHVLEIGGGWGAFAVEAAKQIGCRVTAITLSEEQHRTAVERARAEGVEDRVEVLLCDYRDVTGAYDRIVSIEMLEAVGHERLELFFETCNRLLKPDGVLALQFITVPDYKYDQYRRNCDWIQHYIFPGGLCPSVSAVCSAAARSSPLVVEHIENIGPSYARTLKEWRERFRKSSAELLALGYDDRFQRMWEYYLAYCEAGFASRYLGTMQMVLTRPYNRSIGLCPGYV